jgi:hypothetical protein
MNRSHLKGMGVSPGIAIGEPVVHETRPLATLRIPIPAHDVEDEVARFSAAVAATVERIRDNRLLLAKEGDVHNGGLDFYPQSYGSILRFGREGGSLEKTGGGAQAGNGQLLVTPAEWNEKATFDYPGSRFARVVARGCDLVVPHVAPVVAEAGGPRIYCQCQHAQFKVDRFDRLFVPDAMSFEVRIHDSEGNVLTRFGAYGNADCKGSKSQTPRPEIPLAWGFSVMASDRFAYVGDNLNRRIVKVRLNYSEEKACPAP